MKKELGYLDLKVAQRSEFFKLDKERCATKAIYLKVGYIHS